MDDACEIVSGVMEVEGLKLLKGPWRADGMSEARKGITGDQWKRERLECGDEWRNKGKQNAEKASKSTLKGNSEEESYHTAM